MNEARVFLVQNALTRDGPEGLLRPKYNIEPARQYGHIVEVLDPRMLATSIIPVSTALRHALRDYNDEDSLLAIGAPNMLLLAGAFAAQANNGRVFLLHWDRATASYQRLGFSTKATSQEAA